MAKKLLHIENLDAGYTTPIIRSFTLSLKAGDRIGISGPNGTGKSTLLRTIVGKANCFKGCILRPPKGEVAYLAQQNPDDRDLSVSGKDVLRLLRANAPLPDFLLGLTDMRLDRMSAGQRQLIKVWAILHTEAKLIMLDEPTSSIDAKSKQLVANIIEQMESDRGAIIVSHDMGFLQATCNNIMELST
jgi:ATPase subunit of ABC transporter with duplicated ATPase domains